MVSLAKTPNALFTACALLLVATTWLPFGAEGAEPTELPVNFEKAFQLTAPRELSGRIAFQATIEGTDRLLVIDLDAQRIRKLVDGPGNNSTPAWSPNGRQVAFSSDRDGNREIYIAEWGGEYPVRYTNSPAHEENPTWSPDGKRLIFQSAKGADDPANLALISVEGGGAQLLTNFSGRNTVPRWSPDGTVVAFSTNRFWPGWDLCLWNLGSKSELCILTGAQTYCRGSFSPDGKQIVYSFGAFSQVDLAVTEIASGVRRPIASLPGKSYDATFSPDGKVVVFAAEDGRKEIFNLYLARELNNKWEVKPLLKAPYSLRFPSWSGMRTLELESERMRLQQIAAATAAAAPLVVETETPSPELITPGAPTPDPTSTPLPSPGSPTPKASLAPLATTPGVVSSGLSLPGAR
jgi:Tol biopolymer transport system component